MQQLEQTYKVKGQTGFTYHIEKREGDVVMARMEKDQHYGNPQRGWEVFVVQKYPDRWSPDGKVFIPAKETPPPSTKWGTLGFSYGPHMREEAEARFIALQKWVADKAKRVEKKNKNKNKDAENELV